MFETKRIVYGGGMAVANFPEVMVRGVAKIARRRFDDGGDLCSHIIGAMASRKHELVIIPRGKLGEWLKVIAPNWVDRVASEIIKVWK